MTVAHYETPNHNDINKLGITPNQVVSPGELSPQQVGQMGDAQYEAALASLEG